MTISESFLSSEFEVSLKNDEKLFSFLNSEWVSCEVLNFLIFISSINTGVFFLAGVSNFVRRSRPNFTISIYNKKVKLFKMTVNL